MNAERFQNMREMAVAKLKSTSSDRKKAGLGQEGPD